MVLGYQYITCVLSVARQSEMFSDFNTVINDYILEST